MIVNHLVNELITAKEVRLIGDVNCIIKTREALIQAQQQGLDLVIVSDAIPPIAKILNYGKYRYDLIKHEKEVAKKSRALQSDLREIQLRPVTDLRDVEIKAKKARSFLSEGDRVKVIVKFKGREVNYSDMGKLILENFLKNLNEHKIEKPIALNGRDMIMIVAPTKTVVTT